VDDILAVSQRNNNNKYCHTFDVTIPKSSLRTGVHSFHVRHLRMRFLIVLTVANSFEEDVNKLKKSRILLAICSVLRNITPCSPLKQFNMMYVTNTASLLDLFFDPEDGGDMFF
jgi:hypothetical protein